MDMAMTLRKRFKRRKIFFAIAEVRRAIRQCTVEWDDRVQRHREVTLDAFGPVRGRALLSYRIEGFILEPDSPSLQRHTNFWQSVQMARTLTELGFIVDVIDYRNLEFHPRHDYSLFIDVRNNMERLAPYLGPGCLKIFHIDTAHLLAHNANEAARLYALLQRRGVTIQSSRAQSPNRGIETADCATGNVGEFSLSTFRYAGKPIYPLPAPVAHSFDWPEDRDWDACRRRFIWFGTGGLVHKGLDLVLEAFAGLPDCHLTVCAPLETDPAFTSAYQRELYETPNIDPVGWVQIGGTDFKRIVTTCCAVVFPSCSEGLSTSTLECMHAGLIPVVSHQVGVPTEGIGFEISPCTVDQIRKLVRQVTEMPPDELKSMCYGAWEYARMNHTRARFSEVYREVITQILHLHQTAASPGKQPERLANGMMCSHS